MRHFNLTFTAYTSLPPLIFGGGYLGGWGFESYRLHTQATKSLSIFLWASKVQDKMEKEEETEL